MPEQEERCRFCWEQLDPEDHHFASHNQEVTLFSHDVCRECFEAINARFENLVDSLMDAFNRYREKQAAEEDAQTVEEFLKGFKWS